MDVDPGREARRKEILAAALDLLVEKGYRGTSMLAIARRARASKETLYAWFGSKEGLIETLVSWKAEAQQSALRQAIESTPDDVESVLSKFGTSLLTMFLSNPGLALARIAIGEAQTSPDLGRILMEKGRGRVRPRVVAYLAQMRDRGLLAFDDADSAMDTFIGLLQGDLRLLVLMGTLPSPPEADIEHRARRAAGQFMRLHGTVAQKK